MSAKRESRLFLSLIFESRYSLCENAILRGTRLEKSLHSMIKFMHEFFSIRRYRKVVRSWRNQIEKGKFWPDRYGGA